MFMVLTQAAIPSAVRIMSTSPAPASAARDIEFHMVETLNLALRSSKWDWSEFAADLRHDLGERADLASSCAEDLYHQSVVRATKVHWHGRASYRLALKCRNRHPRPAQGNPHWGSSRYSLATSVGREQPREPEER